MSKIFFDQLNIPSPDYHLGIGSDSHGKQTGKMLEAIDGVLLKEQPDAVIVYGDTNSTLAGALSAAKLHFPVAHVEAGLRSYNRKMPEEINRILADQCSSVLFCPTQKAVNNLKREGFNNSLQGGRLAGKNKLQLHKCKFPLVINVGDIMYDSLLVSEKMAGTGREGIHKKLALTKRKYFLLTIHRAENTDNAANLKNILDAARKISRFLPVVFPIHPRTRERLKQLKGKYNEKCLHFIDPVSYFEMLALEKFAAAILTDSGGMQKEAFFLQTPCVTLRNETEWEETLQDGWNKLVGTQTEKIVKEAKNSSNGLKKRQKQTSLFGDGRASERILNTLGSLFPNS